VATKAKLQATKYSRS